MERGTLYVNSLGRGEVTSSKKGRERKTLFRLKGKRTDFFERGGEVVLNHRFRAAVHQRKAGLGIHWIKKEIRRRKERRPIPPVLERQLRHCYLRPLLLPRSRRKSSPST